MAHNLNIKDGKASFFSAKEVPWHKLGVVTDNALTSKEAIKAAQLDFEVGLGKLYVPVQILNSGETSSHNEVLRVKELGTLKGNIFAKANQVPDKFATYRKDTGDVFGIVGSRYEVIQNQEAFDFFDTIVGQGNAKYETAGALGKGETIFITAKMPDNILVNGKDCIDKYLLFTSAHDGSGSIQILFTPVRVVCNNTLNMALQGAKFRYTIKHTKNAKVKLEMAAEVLGITRKATDDLQAIFDIMAKCKMEDDKLNAYFEQCLGLVKDESGTLTVRSNNIIEDIMKYNTVGVGQDTESCKGTVFGAYNAVTGYFQNVKKYGSNEDKFNDIMLNAGARKMNYAFTLAKQLAL